MDQDKVDLGSDEVEAYADKVDAEKELEDSEKDELGDTGEEGTTELDTEETPEESPEKEEESVGAPDKNLEKTNFKKEKNPKDLDQPKKVKKVFLKRPKK
jgi:hypothetical protein